MNGQQRKFDVERYTISDCVIRLITLNAGQKVVPLQNVMILEEEQ
jgi:hypothetical protein